MATGVLPQREIIKFEAGRPEVVCLKYATGKTVSGLYGDQAMYTTVDNRVFYVDFDVADLIDRCGVPAGEPIQITKHRGAKNAGYWDVRAAGTATGARPAYLAPVPVSQPSSSTAPTSVLEQQLKDSIAKLATVAQNSREKLSQEPAAAPSMPEYLGNLLAECGIAAINASARIESHGIEAGMELQFDQGAIERMSVTLFIETCKRGAR
jgi:hypothetical protein